MARGSAVGEIGTKPFTPAQYLRIDKALAAADASTGLLFSVFVGDLADSRREAAESLLGPLGADARRAVVVVVEPGRRIVDVVTGPEARRRLPDRVCGLAVAAMTSSFAAGDLAGGIVSALDLMRDHAARG